MILEQALGIIVPSVLQKVEARTRKLMELLPPREPLTEKEILDIVKDINISLVCR